jgi:hypothetical protein
MKQRKEITPDAQEKLDQQALQKYRELYNYSTDILLKELERFNRADEKAAKYSTAFVFLLGIIAYFDKWILDKLQWTDFPVGLPADLPLFMVALVGVALVAAWPRYGSAGSPTRNRRQSQGR